MVGHIPRSFIGRAPVGWLSKSQAAAAALAGHAAIGANEVEHLHWLAGRARSSHRVSRARYHWRQDHQSSPCHQESVFQSQLELLAAWPPCRLAPVVARVVG